MAFHLLRKPSYRSLLYGSQSWCVDVGGNFLHSKTHGLKWLIRIDFRGMQLRPWWVTPTIPHTLFFGELNLFISHCQYVFRTLGYHVWSWRELLYSYHLSLTCWYILFTAYTGTIYSQVNNPFFPLVTCERLIRVLGLFLLLFLGISSELCSSLCLRHTCTSVTLVLGDTGKRKMGKLVRAAVFQRREAMNLQKPTSFFIANSLQQCYDI